MVSGGGRCPDCRRDRQRVVDAGRGTAQQRGYTYRWSQVSQVHLRSYPLCGQRAPEAYQDGWRGACHEQGRIRAAACTDHIRAHKGDTSLFWDTRNRQSLCDDCNRVKAIRYEGGFGHKPDGG